MTTQPQEAQAPFEWHRVHSIDEMEAFFMSRLPAIREAARSCGYAIGLHGSLRRDFDLIAVPWVEDHADADTLARAVHLAACGLSTVYSWTQKPAGRIATSMAICWTDDSMGFDTDGLGHLDLSIMPAGSACPQSEAGWVDGYMWGLNKAWNICHALRCAGTPSSDVTKTLTEACNLIEREMKLSDDPACAEVRT